MVVCSVSENERLERARDAFLLLLHAVSSTEGVFAYPPETVHLAFN